MIALLVFVVCLLLICIGVALFVMHRRNQKVIQNALAMGRSGGGARGSGGSRGSVNRPWRSSAAANCGASSRASRRASVQYGYGGGSGGGRGAPPAVPSRAPPPRTPAMPAATTYLHR